MKYVYEEPGYHKKSFNCPHCGAYSHQEWTFEKNTTISKVFESAATSESFFFAKCANCNKYSIWFHKEMIYPLMAGIEPVNNDAPETVRIDYEEASRVVNISPRSANALLRLALQKLCVYLGADRDKNLDGMIAQLVEEKGLSKKIQKAMDAIRVYGNDSVHIGVINDSDTKETAICMFRLINIIIENMITEEKMITKLMDGMTDGQKEHIKNRKNKKS